jgi:peptide/nickel transport system substrate-binding protein
MGVVFSEQPGSTPDSRRRDRSRDGRKGWRAIAASIATALVVSACSADRQVDIAELPELRMSFGRVLGGSTEPWNLLSLWDYWALSGVGEQLIDIRSGGTEIINVLAETFEASEDGLRYDFTLKQGIQFHGEWGEVTADDVKFSFERSAAIGEFEGLESIYSAPWSSLLRVEVTDRYSGTIVLSSPEAPFLTNTVLNPHATITSRAAYEALGERFATTAVGTGPYQVLEGSYNPEQGVTLVPFEDYSGAHPEFTGHNWRQIRSIVIIEEGPREIAFEAGEVDFIEVGAEAFARQEAAGAQAVAVPVINYMWMGMNLRHPNLSDIRVRRAIRAAIDRQQVIDGGGTTLSGALLSEHWINDQYLLGVWKGAPYTGPDTDTAKRLIEEAGATGREILLQTPPNWADAAQVIQAQLAEVGLRIQIEVLEAAAFNAIAFDDGVDKFQLNLSHYGANADPSSVTIWHSCEEVGSYNRSSWCNEEAQRIHEEGPTEPDPVKRDLMYQRWSELMHEDAAVVPIAHRVSYYASTTDISTVFTNAGRPRPWLFSRS